ncbi:ATP-binding cassette domain-containing protein [Streptomyces virginiae]|nr:ABC transporter ATP-binding protein [Streptomyces virginiae]
MITVLPALQATVSVLGDWGIQLGSVLNRLALTCNSPISRPTPSARKPIGSDLRVRDLSFAYSSTATPVVSGLSLDLLSGSHLAVVGPSGVGKSTLARIIGGLEAGQGVVTIGGVTPQSLPRDLVRNFVTIIPQESYVFSGTLLENLLYLNPHATPPQIQDAVKAFSLEHLVERTGGLGGIVGIGGTELSDSDRQSLSLARAYLSPAPIVILDEATSHLSPSAEARAENMFSQRPGTLIVIAHRLSSARRAKLILLLDEKENFCGTHEELLRSSQLYRDLTQHWHGTAQKSPREATAVANS